MNIFNTEFQTFCESEVKKAFEQLSTGLAEISSYEFDTTRTIPVVHCFLRNFLILDRKHGPFLKEDPSIIPLQGDIYELSTEYYNLKIRIVFS